MVSFKRGAIDREVFFAGLPQRLRHWKGVCSAPHFPAREGVLYLETAPKAARTGRFDELVDRFSPATPQDKELIRAAFLTPLSGVEPGQRPMFAITSDCEGDPMKGIGTGKTKLVQMIAELCGGMVSVSPQASSDSLTAMLLAPTASAARVAMIDNLKTHNFSHWQLESLVTAAEINGRKLYAGHGCRPNYLTFFVTINGPSFSKDMAQRSVVIRLERPAYSSQWEADTLKHVREHRTEILAEMRWYLQRKPKPISCVGRWGPWGLGVLSRVRNPETLPELIQNRQSSIDGDDADAESIVEEIGRRIAMELRNFSLDTSAAFVGIAMVCEWLREAGLGDPSRRKTQCHLRLLQHSCLRYSTVGNRRGYVWTGPKAKTTATVEVVRDRLRPGR